MQNKYYSELKVGLYFLLFIETILTGSGGSCPVLPSQGKQETAARAKRK